MLKSIYEANKSYKKGHWYFGNKKNGWKISTQKKAFQLPVNPKNLPFEVDQKRFQLENREEFQWATHQSESLKAIPNKLKEIENSEYH